MSIKELKKEIIENGKKKTDLTAMIVRAEVKEAKSGSSYWAIDLCDTTGEISLKKWTVDPSDKLIIIPGKVVDVTGATCQVYQGVAGLIAKDNGIIENITASPIDFVRNIIKPQDVLLKEFKALLDSIKNEDCKKIIGHFMKDEGDFIVFPAAERMHHAVMHGLLAHTISVCRYAVVIYNATVAAYGDTTASLDVILTGCVLHDFYKIKEYEMDEQGNAKVRPTVIGGNHITLAAEELEFIRRSNLVEDEELIMRLKHIVLSHHGKEEWGAMCKPATLEAYIVHTCDNLDAKVFNYYDTYSVLNDGEMTKDKVFALESRAYKPEKKN